MVGDVSRESVKSVGVSDTDSAGSPPSIVNGMRHFGHGLAVFGSAIVGFDRTPQPMQIHWAGVRSTKALSHAVHVGNAPVRGPVRFTVIPQPEQVSSTGLAIITNDGISIVRRGEP